VVVAQTAGPVVLFQILGGGGDVRPFRLAVAG
jgi:hypothetical protein